MRRDNQQDMLSARLNRRELARVLIGTAIGLPAAAALLPRTTEATPAEQGLPLPDGVALDPAVRNPARFVGRELVIVPGYSKDWQQAVSTQRPGGPLASHAYEKNGFCETEAFRCNVELRPYNYKTLQGSRVEVPGVGVFDAKDRGFRSVVVGLYNLDPNAVSYDRFGPGQIYVENGFLRSGRIFDGKRIEETEQAIMQHEVNQQFVNEQSSSETGITGTPENARSVLAVSLIRVNNIFELTRAQIIQRP